MTEKKNVVDLAAALELARRELAAKSQTHAFWHADAYELEYALANVGPALIRATLDEIATTGSNSARSRELRDEVKRRLATRGLNRFACAGVSCALAHAVRKLTTNR